ncbi:histidine ammonia-lyase/phenylalanine ammonia-lyase [Crossiella equi]|uniref:Histidine ammonia-lyase/phenylalanine ammonia-lyase n=1 Tax=Crossiella equi TaxID=130796 RepID=A0ABS5A4Z7_9PSEU|nr:aromatic amino acid ammonia-lyase [Crossiella equi]MBP2471626.1 histidine ammonia-lyase/phenylalanine ammonia-lyase [Crossiella equi]
MFVLVDGRSLTLEQVAAVARDGLGARLGECAERGMRGSQELKDKLLRTGRAIYGVSTGFGDSVIRQIAPVKAVELQRNLIRYHVNGTGPDVPADVVRATLLIRANCLAKGNSGIRPEVVARLLWLLRHDVLPFVPERGSVGASGDLVPLCHVAEVLLGEGDVLYRGQRRVAGEVLAEYGLTPVVLEPKEGLALINGTSFSAAFASLALVRARELAAVAELCTAMTAEAVLGNRGHFAAFIHEAKPHPGQLRAARAVAELLHGSELALDHSQVVELTGGLDGQDYAHLKRSIQDRYSIRCAPHVIGVLHDTLEWASRWVEIEINSSNDNPLFDTALGEVHSGGNFYGGHLAQAMDSVKTAVANVADLLDRQLAHVVDEKFSNGLPPNLVPWHSGREWRAGLHHGFKGMQIACSAVTAEALQRSVPASVFSRSTEAHNQDKVSMSAIAARDALRVVELAEEVTVIHLLALCQALDLRGVHRCAPQVRAAHARVRDHAPPLHDDRGMASDIRAVLAVLREVRPGAAA